MHISHLLFSYRLGVSGPACSVVFCETVQGRIACSAIYLLHKSIQWNQATVCYAVRGCYTTERQSVARIMWPKPSSRARAIARRTAKASASSGAVTSLSKMLAARSQAGSSVVPDHDTDSHASSRNKQRCINIDVDRTFRRWNPTRSWVQGFTPVRRIRGRTRKNRSPL